jgi:hypothetical protein
MKLELKAAQSIELTVEQRLAQLASEVHEALNAEARFVQERAFADSRSVAAGRAATEKLREAKKLAGPVGFSEWLRAHDIPRATAYRKIRDEDPEARAVRLAQERERDAARRASLGPETGKFPSKKKGKRRRKPPMAQSKTSKAKPVKLPTAERTGTDKPHVSVLKEALRVLSSTNLAALARTAQGLIQAQLKRQEP